MYGGEQRLVEIRFINPLLDAVVDRFGTKDGSPFNPSAVVVLYDGKPQSVLSQKTAELITEQVVSSLALTNSPAKSLRRCNNE